MNSMISILCICTHIYNMYTHIQKHIKTHKRTISGFMELWLYVLFGLCDFPEEENKKFYSKEKKEKQEKTFY